MKNIFVIVTALLLIQCNGNKNNDKEKEVKKPNLIYVVTDQWRAEAVGYAGNSDVKTPNLDKLAEESVVFNNAISGLPSCAPYRASLMTGQYWQTHGVFYNDKPLDPEATSIAKVYKEAGYKTGYIGKWHLNGDPHINPTLTRNEPVPKERRQGFDYWKAREVTHRYNSSFYFDENNERKEWEGYDAFAQTEDAISYIDEKSEDEEPFILFLSLGPPHDPYSTAPEEFKEMYDDPSKLKLRPNVPDSLSFKAKRALAGYYAHIAALDVSMGKLIKAVEENNIDENTILVFTSDHGDMLYSHGEKKKQQPWDESIKVPFILHYPAKLGKEGKELNMPFNAPDIMPSLLSLSEISVPSTVEGEDFSAYITGEKEEENKATLITSIMPYHNWSPAKGGREYRGVRTQRYTYVRDLNGPWLLYDNEEDPYQLNNLVNEKTHRDVQERLEEDLKEILKRIGDEFLPGDHYMEKWDYSYDPQDG